MAQGSAGRGSGEAVNYDYEFRERRWGAELKYALDRLRCAVCERPVEHAEIHESHAHERGGLTIVLRCHGRIERRSWTTEEMRLAGSTRGEAAIERILAPFAERQAWFRKRLDPTMMQFRRHRQSSVRRLLRTA